MKFNVNNSIRVVNIFFVSFCFVLDAMDVEKNGETPGTESEGSQRIPFEMLE